jgi:hypothetical protein
VKVYGKMVKMQAVDWEKIFANHKSEKGIMFRIYKDLKISTG